MMLIKWFTSAVVIPCGLLIIGTLSCVSVCVYDQYTRYVTDTTLDTDTRNDINRVCHHRL